jgi:exopolysaccharide biosynthesis predicted pyruvyltransferase EpsI
MKANIKNKLISLVKMNLSRAVLYFEIMSIIISLIFREKKKMIYLFGSPYHSNLGDQAQTYCIQYWCKEHFPEYGLFIFSLRVSKNIVLNTLRIIIHKHDILLCHSGYHMTDLYDEKQVYYKIIKMFSDYPITIFPQTVNFFDKIEELKAISICDYHPDLTLLCRDVISYENAKRMFKRTKLLCYPDIVTILIGTYTYSNKREGILFCKRNDRESFYTHDEIIRLRDRLNNITTTEITDTTLPVQCKRIIRNRKKILEEIFNEYSKYKLILTDRYHGMIFSLIAETPVIILKSTDHKITSGVNWFPNDLFGNYVTVAENLEMAFNLVMERINSQPLSRKLPPYFKETYFNTLLNHISIGDSV